jgi:ATP phosphoribosyltransferase regulatory subunit
MTIPDRWLLPDGIEEVLPAEARRLEALRRQALDLFASWGYEFVMPPLIEYLDALLTGVGKELDLQTVKLTDQVSGRLVGVRADMTPQAARIDAHYLKREGPTRLCYVGPVLRSRPAEFAGTREPLQIGAELYGYAGVAADAEVLQLMMAALDLFGVVDPHIDLGHVGIFKGLTAAAEINGEREAELFEAVQRKAASEVRQLLASWACPARLSDMLVGLIELNGDSSVLAQAKTLFADAPLSVTKALAELEAVASAVHRSEAARPLYFDLAELQGYGYHTGLVFSAFVPGHGRAVANGGRYDGIGAAFGRVRPATGFGADLRQLVRLSTIENGVRSGILAPGVDDDGLRTEIRRLRKSGERVVQQLPDQYLDAGELGCDRKLVEQKGGWVIQPI